ncbi:MAG: penicillin-binding transpeptidase domain-containing protein [Solirubrobacteraceae bacterium]
MLTRTAPVIALAAGAFAAGAVLATQPGRDEHQLVTRYVRAWEHSDIVQMYSMLDSRSRARTSEPAFAHALEATADTATVTALEPLHVASLQGNSISVRMIVTTKLWGVLHETLAVPLRGSGSSARVRLTPQMLFPGLRPGERIGRRITLPPRATILASDGETLAQGSARSSPISDVAIQIVGTVGPIPPALASHYAALGYPTGAQVGLDGLESIFQDRLAGALGGTLLAGHRVLARTRPMQAKPVRTTIVPALERAAVASLGGQYAGMSVMDPRTGALEALAGIAFSAVQPPGSTMKIITATGALQAGIATLGTTFPIMTGATIDGFTMQNASGEACGGTLLNAFAVSCNSVFAPLGVKLGAARLVATAQRFGFNQPPSIPGAAESTIPSAHTIGDALSVGSSAIGQGMVQTTPLEMADVAATIAMGGRRPIPTLLAGQTPRFTRVTPAKIAHEVQQTMVAVVQFGTGVSAQIPGVEVAGKTGTAELKDTSTTNPNNPNANNPKNTDAWFVGYAPVGDPKVVVGALFPNQGAGGAVAAPPVRDVIAAALQH